MKFKYLGIWDVNIHVCSSSVFVWAQTLVKKKKGKKPPNKQPNKKPKNQNQKDSKLLWEVGLPLSWLHVGMSFLKYAIGEI